MLRDLSIPRPAARIRTWERPLPGRAPPVWMVRWGTRGRACFPARALAQASPVAEQVWPAMVVFAVVAACSLAVALVR